MKIVVAGGTGFIGRALTAALLEDGHHVVVLTRSAHPAAPARVRAVTWDPGDPAGAWSAEVADAGAVVNLAGATIGRPFWTAARRRVLVRSRTVTGSALAAAIAALPAARRPPVLLNASGIDYYGDRGDEVVTEETPAGASFLAQMAVEWERAALQARDSGVRVVLLRQSIVLGRGSPTLTLLALPFRLFAGGPLGGGDQWFSWIHLADVVGLYRHAIATPELDGPVNAAAPGAVRQRELAAELGRVLHRPSAVRVPAPVLRLALRGQADLLLHGRRARPDRALATGYAFRFPDIGPALEEALRR